MGEWRYEVVCLASVVWVKTAHLPLIAKPVKMMNRSILRWANRNISWRSVLITKTSPDRLKTIAKATLIVIVILLRLSATLCVSQGNLIWIKKLPSSRSGGSPHGQQ